MARRRPQVGRPATRKVWPAKQPRDQELSPWTKLHDGVFQELERRELHVVALDYGMKWNIARHLRDAGCRVTVLPGTATSEDVLQHNRDGVFLSNGPGDPEPLDYAIQTIGDLLGRKPLFGICLGHLESLRPHLPPEAFGLCEGDCLSRGVSVESHCHDDS